MAREAGLEMDNERETMTLDHADGAVEFDIPLVKFDTAALAGVDVDELG